MSYIYSPKVMKHFLNPKHFGKIKNATAKGKAGNPRCGDVMEIFLKIEKKNKKEVIKDIKFQTMGCTAAIAASDMVCEIVKGKTLEEALKVKYEDINKELGYLPPVKVHCTQLAQRALKKAIENYKKSKK